MAMHLVAALDHANHDVVNRTAHDHGMPLDFARLRSSHGERGEDLRLIMPL